MKIFFRPNQIDLTQLNGFDTLQSVDFDEVMSGYQILCCVDLIEDAFELREPYLRLTYSVADDKLPSFASNVDLSAYAAQLGTSSIEISLANLAAEGKSEAIAQAVLSALIKAKKELLEKKVASLEGLTPFFSIFNDKLEVCRSELRQLNSNTGTV